MVLPVMGRQMMSPIMKTMYSRTAGSVLLGLTIALAGVPAIHAQEEPPPQGGERGPGGGRMGGGMFAMGGNSAHGTVTAVSGNEITVRNEQGESWKILTGPNTHFRKDRQEAKITDVHTGDVIVAAGNLDDQAKSVGAVFVVVLDPQQAAQMEKMRADFGKTWTMGKVTAIKDLTLTIERPDHVTQTVTVDENTTFRKRREDITFPDIKVGDMVRASGASQNGSFVAKNLAVMEPGQRGQGRFVQGGPGGPGTPDRPAPQPEGAPSGTTPAQPPNSPQN